MSRVTPEQLAAVPKQVERDTLEVMQRGEQVPELNARIERLERVLRESLRAVNEMYGSRHWLARKIRRVLREGEA